MGSFMIWKLDSEGYLRHSCHPNGYCSAYMRDDKCWSCKEPIPEYIKIQLKLLHPNKWGYLWAGK